MIVTINESRLLKPAQAILETINSYNTMAILTDDKKIEIISYKEMKNHQAILGLNFRINCYNTGQITLFYKKKLNYNHASKLQEDIKKLDKFVVVEIEGGQYIVNLIAEFNLTNCLKDTTNLTNILQFLIAN